MRAGYTPTFRVGNTFVQLSWSGHTWIVSAAREYYSFLSLRAALCHACVLEDCGYGVTLSVASDRSFWGVA